MNILAASLLYHAKDYVAFWLLVILLNKLKLRELFEKDMKGFKKHSDLIDMMI